MRLIDWRTNIPEIISNERDYRIKRAQSKSAYGKYAKAIKRFTFLDIIIRPKIKTDAEGKIEDDAFEKALTELFNSLGFNSVVPPTKKDVDLKCSFKDLKFGIEAKNGKTVSENDMFQGKKYHSRQGQGWHPLVIWNNSKLQIPFTSEQILDATLNEYGILTTEELYKGYIRLKTGIITFDFFIEQLQKIGLIEFKK